MKRIIAAVSFALLAPAVFAAEIDAPFEQAQLIRPLPNVESALTLNSASSGASLFGDHVGLPYDRTLPEARNPVITNQSTPHDRHLWSDGSARADRWLR